MGPKPINIAQAYTYLELMDEGKKKLMLSRHSNSCIATPVQVNLSKTMSGVDDPYVAPNPGLCGPRLATGKSCIY